MDKEKDKKNPVLDFIWRNRKTNSAVMIFGVIALLIVVLLLNKYYTATVSILPSNASFTATIGGELGALANLAGIGSIGAGGLTQEMYQGIIHSRKLQLRLLNTFFTVQHDDFHWQGKLLDFLDIEGDSQREIIEKALKMLNEEVLFTEIDTDNNILYVQVTLQDPFLAAKVADTLVTYLDDVVRHQVQREYQEQYDYLKNRLTVIKDSLTISEDQLRRFLERTKNLNTPENVIKELRLKRTLSIQSTILAELKKQEEIFVLKNMINLSPVKVLDRAMPPYKKSRPKRLFLLIALILLWVTLQLAVNVFIVSYRNFKRTYSAG